MPETNPLPDAALDELERLLESVVKGDNWKEIQQFFALCKEHLPALLLRLRSAEVERAQLAEELGRIKPVLSARDARMKREGAIEALEEIANLIRQTTPDARSASNVERGKFEGRMYAIEQIESEAAKLRGGE